MSKNLVIGLKKPYLFEDEEYAAIDLSGMENLTMQDAIEAQKNVVGTGVYRRNRRDGSKAARGVLQRYAHRSE